MGSEPRRQVEVREGPLKKRKQESRHPPPFHGYQGEARGLPPLSASCGLHPSLGGSPVTPPPPPRMHEHLLPVRCPPVGPGILTY